MTKKAKKSDKKTGAAAAAQAAGFAKEELVGKLLQVCVGNLEKIKTTWNTTSQKAQDVAINAMTQAIEKAVRDAVLVISTNRKAALYATVDSVKFTDQIVCNLSLSKAMEGRHELADAAGHTVCIIIASPEEFVGGAEKVKSQPDQTSLKLATEGNQQEGYEIVPPASGFKWRILKDQMPIPGAPKGFDDQAEAEKWLQEHLKVGKHKGDKDDKK